MRVLVACEFSGVVRNAFLARGHDAYSCDILPGLNPTHDRHIQRDVSPLLGEPWDLVIAHPPCTYLTKLGAAKRAVDFGRRLKMLEAVDFFVACLNANAPRVCVENPIMFLDARARIGVDPSQKICPSQFGHDFTKATYLWLKGLPLLVPTDVREVIMRGTPGRRDATSVHRSKQPGLLRSITHRGIAEAMADQWGAL